MINFVTDVFSRAEAAEREEQLLGVVIVVVDSCRNREESCS